MGLLSSCIPAAGRAPDEVETGIREGPEVAVGDACGAGVASGAVPGLALVSELRAGEVERCEAPPPSEIVFPMVSSFADSLRTGNPVPQCISTLQGRSAWVWMPLGNGYSVAAKRRIWSLGKRKRAAMESVTVTVRIFRHKTGSGYG